MKKLQPVKELIDIDIKKLKVSPFNPIYRTNMNTPRMKELVKSINEVGLIAPIILAGDNRIICGHRRVAAHIELGLQKVLALRYNSTTAKDYPEIFLHESKSMQSLTRSQELDIYLLGGPVTRETGADIIGLQSMVGIKQLHKLKNRNLSATSYYNEMKRLRNYIADFKLKPIIKWDRKLAVQTLTWLLTYGVLGLRLPIKAELTPTKIIQHIANLEDFEVTIS